MRVFWKVYHPGAHMAIIDIYSHCAPACSAMPHQKQLISGAHLITIWSRCGSHGRAKARVAGNPRRHRGRTGPHKRPP